MAKELITKENWDFSGYKTKDLQVFITFGADPSNIEECLYFVTLMNEDFQEIFQKEFRSIDEAINFINKKYSEWEWLDRSGSDAEGCGSCSAH